MRDLMAELMKTARALGRRPTFSGLVVGTLALGLGATTTLFTLVRGVLLEPLPYADADRVVAILGTLEGREGYDTVSLPNLLDMRQRARSFSAIAGYDEWEPVLSGHGAVERLAGASVTADFFAVMGMPPRSGRHFLPAEDVPGSARSVVVSHRLWSRRFGSDPSLVGRALTLNGTAYEVVGIAAPELEDPALSGPGWGAPDLWRVAPAYFGAGASRDGFAFTAIGRLRPGVALAAAEAELQGIMAALTAAYPEDNTGHGVRVERLHDRIVGPVRAPLLALLAGTGLLLLVGTANVANLVFARSLERRQEVAVRAALGAGSGRLARLLALEGIVLALAGGGLGLLLSLLGTRAILRLAAADLPRAARVAPDGSVALFAVGVALVVGLAIGLLPAWRAAAGDLAAAMRHDGQRQAGRRGDSRTRGVLVAVEVALSLVLLVGAGLMLRTLAALLATDPGFRPGGVLAVEVDPPYPRYDDTAEVQALWDGVTDRLEALPGVTAAGAINLLPMAGDFDSNGFAVAGRPAPLPGEELSAETRLVTPGFAAAAGVPLRSGRWFADADGAAPLAVVDETMARRMFPGENPVGQRLALRDITFEVVGVAAAVRHKALALPPEPTLYLSWRGGLDAFSGAGYLLLRTNGDPAALAGEARAALAEVAPDLPAGEVRAVRDVVAASAGRSRLQAALLGCFAGLSLLIGAVGIYGVVASATAARRRELSLRAALGAGRRQLVGLAVGQGMAPVAAGVAVGLAGAWAASRLLASMLYGVTAADAATFGGAAALLLVVAGLACWLPARRAAAADPALVLREG